MTHEEKIAQWIRAGSIGVEIGPGTSPVPGLHPPPLYVDCFKAFGGAACHADYYGHACALPFHEHSLDYVLASHVLEHVANPVAALAEWYRVVRPGGIIYLIVPDRRATWEHARALTPVDHMIEDYWRSTTAVDASHIDEFVFNADWSLFSPDTRAEDVAEKQAELARTLHWAVKNGEDINIHFHTFEPANLRTLLQWLSRGVHGRARTPLRAGAAPVIGKQDNGWSALRGGGHEQAQALHRSDETAGSGVPALPEASELMVPRFNWEIVDFAAGFPAANPNGVLAILRVDKTWQARAEAELYRLRTRGDPQAMLRRDAVRFDEWAARAEGPYGAI